MGQLQFEVVAFRLQDEYGVQCVFDNIAVYTARWVTATDPRKLEEFRTRAYDQLSVDHNGELVFLATWCCAPQAYMTLERWPDIGFHETREHQVE